MHVFGEGLLERGREVKNLLSHCTTPIPYEGQMVLNRWQIRVYIYEYVSRCI